jgi:predicted transcriptional regulator
MATTIQVTHETKEALEGMKIVPRETYEDVIRRLIEISRQEEELDTETLENIKKSLEDIREGRLLSTEEVKKELGIT